MQNKKLINISQAVVGSKGIYSIEFHEDEEYTQVKRFNQDGTESLFSVGGGEGPTSSSYIQTLELTDNGLTLNSTGIGSAFNTTLDLTDLRIGSVRSAYINGNSPALNYTGGVTPADSGLVAGDWMIDLDTSNIWYLANPNTNVWVQSQPSGGVSYTAGTGIDINNGVISSTVVDTDTNNYISNVVLSGTDLVFTGVGSAANKTVPLATLGGGSAPENLVLRIQPVTVPVMAGGGQDVLFSALGNSVAANSLHVNPLDLSFVGAGEIEAVSDCIAKISLGAYIDTGSTNGQITFQIFEVVGGTSTPIGSASFELSNQAVSSIPVSFSSFFDLTAGNIYKFSAYSTQNSMNINPGSFIQFEIL